MKKVEVLTAGMYYNPDERVTVHLEERVYDLVDSFADLVVDEDGGDYTDEEAEDKSSGELEPLDYSAYKLTAAALKLAVAKEMSYELMDVAHGTGANGRITKEDLDEVLSITDDGSEE